MFIFLKLDNIMKEKKTKEDYFGGSSGVFPDGTKINREDIDLRRAMIMEDRMALLTIKQIAEKYQIHEKTVSKDISVFKKKEREKILEIDKDSLVGEILFWWDILYQKTKQTYDQAKSVSEKNSTINTMVKVLRSRIEYMFDLGVLHKVKEDASNSNVIDGIDIENASLGALMDLLKKKGLIVTELQKQVQ